MADNWTSEDEARYLAGVATADVPESVRDYMRSEESFPDDEHISQARPEAQRDAMDTENEATQGHTQRDDPLDQAVWAAILKHEANLPQGGRRSYAEGGQAEGDVLEGGGFTTEPSATPAPPIPEPTKPPLLQNGNLFDPTTHAFIGPAPRSKTPPLLQGGNLFDAETKAYLGPAPAKPAEKDETPSALGAGVRGAVRGAVPAATGLVGAGAGMEVGAALGALGGPAAPVTVPVGALVGALAGGLGAGYLGGEAQEKALQYVPEWLKHKIGQSEEQRRADVEAHPYAAQIGEIAPNVLAFRPGAIARGAEEAAGAVGRVMANPVTQRALPAGLMGGQEAIMQGIQDEPIDWTKVGIAAGAGALMNKETALGRRLIETGAAPARSVLGRAPPTVAPGTTPPPPGGAPPPGDLPPVGEAFGMDVGRGVEPVRVAAHTPEGDVVLEDAEGQKHPMAAADVARLRQDIPPPEPGTAPAAAVEPPAPPAAAVEAPVPVPAAEPPPPAPPAAAPAAAPVTRVTPPTAAPPARAPDLFGDDGSVMANLDRIGAEIEAGPEAERAKLEAVVKGLPPEAAGAVAPSVEAQAPAVPPVERPEVAPEPPAAAALAPPVREEPPAPPEDALPEFQTIRQAEAFEKRTAQEQAKRRELLSDPNALRRYADERGISPDELRDLLTNNYRTNADLLAGVRRFLASDEAKARKETETANAATVTFKPIEDAETAAANQRAAAERAEAEEPPAPVVAPEAGEAAPAPTEAERVEPETQRPTITIEQAHEEALKYPNADNYAAVAGHKYGLSHAQSIELWNQAKAQRAAGENPVPPTERPATEAPQPNTDEIRNQPQVTEEKHTKTKADLFYVRFPEKLSREDYERFGTEARKTFGGYYSSFRGGGAKPGFIFPSRDAADRFAEWSRQQLGGTPAERPAPAVENPVEAEDNPLDAARARHQIAYAEFTKARDAYRARQIGDEEFMAAKAAYDRAGSEYDAAIEAAPNAPPAAENVTRVTPSRTPSPEITNPINKSLYTGYFDALSGRPNILSQAGDPMIDRLRPFYDRGLIDGPNDIQALVNADFDPARAGLERPEEPSGPGIEGDYERLPDRPQLPPPAAEPEALPSEARVPTSEPISPVEETGHGIQGTLPPGAAGARSEAVHGAEEVRPTREPSAPEDRGGLQPAGSDAGERPAPERGEAPGSGGDRAGAADRVPAAREPTAPGTPRRPVEPTRDIDLSEPGEIAKPADTGRAVDLIQGQNHVIEPGTLAEARGPVVKARDNIAAIELAKRLIEDGRPATREEQAQLAQYTGWGGLSGAFPDSNGKLRKGFEDIGARLKEILSPKEYEAAERSTQYAHYTSEPVIRSMWDAVSHLGFKGGNVFEPGMGVGHFLGMMPADMAKASRYQGIEVDPLTAQIAKLLYPESGVRQADFIRTPLPENAFDLAIGNPPFADIVVQGDPKYTARGFLLHDYFFAKSLDSVRPGGLLAFVTSAGTMNKLDDAARRFMAERAEFVGGVRLPSTAFAKSAGTEVTTDILFFKKHPFGQQDLGDNPPPWTETTVRSLPNAQGSETQGNVSRYFSEHPEQVLGHEGFFDKLYKDRYAVHENPEAGDLETQLRAAMGRLPADIMADAPTPEQKAALDFSSTEHKDGSFYLQNGQLQQYINGAGRPVAKRGAGVEGGYTTKELETIRQLVPIRDALREVYAADIAEDGPGAAAARQKLNRFYDDFVAKNGPINKSESTYRRPSRVQQEGARSEAREEARELGNEFQEGDFDAQPMIAKGMKVAEIARLRDAARERAKQQGREFDEGTFDPEAMPDLVLVKRQNIDPFGDDPESYRLRAIEEYDERTGEASKRRIFRESVLTRQQDPEIRSAHDGVLWSLNKFGALDIDKIAEKTGSNREAVISELGDRVFRLPQTRDSYQISDEYLSGDVVSKLELARAEAERDPTMARNVAALEKVQPAPLSPAEIEIRLGMPWVPLDVVRRFMTERLQLGERQITYSPHFGKWILDTGDRNRYGRSSSYGQGEAEWATQKVNAYEILDNALNRVAPKVYDKQADGSRQLNPEATQAAQDKVEAMRQAFSDWVYANPELTDTLGRTYNQKYNRVVLRDWNGDYLTTPGISSDWSWRPHQTRGIARVIQSGNTYMAHAVGAGKTSVAISSAMEMRRLGLVNKPMIVVPNHMLGQFAKEWYEQYPTARLMIADERRFHTDRRRQFVADVAQQDLDGVVITNSAFKRIGVSREFESHLIEEAIAELDEAMTALGQDPSNLTKISPDASGNRITVKKLQNRKQKLEEKLRGHMAGDVDQTNTFEELGIDFLFVDEAHQFRKLSYTTQQNLKGIDPSGSDMAWDLYAKTRYLDTRKPGRSLVLMSGTPITNTMGELYTVSRYLQPQALAEQGVKAFDAWAQTFGDTKTELEQTAQGTYEPVTRFSQMTNVPELYKMVGQVMDVVTPTELSQYVTRPEIKGGERQFHLAPRTPWLEEFQRGLAARVEAIRARKGPPEKGDDILLSVINDGRLGSIDPRLVDPSQPNDPSSKLNQAIDNIHQIWKDTANQQFRDPESKKPLFRGPATQLVFSNLGINGREQPDGRPGFSGYRWMRSELIRRGVPSDQIAFIKDYDTPLAKQRLFNDVNEGKVRILIGSTQKMGTGLNVQRRLSAVHNLDPLWFPADDEQRVGRILRQGNLNPEIEIHDYSTKGTYDSTMWQMMGRKGRFIEQFFLGDPTLRNMEDLGEASMYEQASAMSTSDERAIKLTELRQELQKTERRQSAHDSEQFGLRWNAQTLAEGIAYSEQSARRYQGDIAQRRETGGDKFAMKVGNQTFQKRAEASEALQNLIDETFPTMAQNSKLTIGEIGGFPLVITKQFDTPTVQLLRSDGSPGPWLGERGAMGRSVIREAERWLGDLEYNRDAMWQQKAEQEQKLAATQGQIGKTFADADKIEPLRARVAALEAELQAAKQAQPFDWNEFAVEMEKNGEAKGPDGKSYKLRAGYSRRGPASYSLLIDDEYAAYGTKPELMQRIRDEATPKEAAPPGAPDGGLAERETTGDGTPARSLTEDLQTARATGEYQPGLADSHRAARDFVRLMGRDSGNEHFGSVDTRTGEIRDAGTSDHPTEINFNQDTLGQLWNPPDGQAVDIHHNHGGGTPASGTDISMLAAPGLRWVVAHGIEGTVNGQAMFSAVSLRPEARAWLDRMSSDDAVRALKNLTQRAKEKIEPLIERLVKSGRIDPATADTIAQETINSALAGTGAVNYMSNFKLPDGVIPFAARIARDLGKDLPWRLSDGDTYNRVRQSAGAVRREEGMGRLSRSLESGSEAGQRSGAGPDQGSRVGAEPAAEPRGPPEIGRLAEEIGGPERTGEGDDPLGLDSGFDEPVRRVESVMGPPPKKPPPPSITKRFLNMFGAGPDSPGPKERWVNPVERLVIAPSNAARYDLGGVSRQKWDAERAVDLRKQTLRSNYVEELKPWLDLSQKDQQRVVAALELERLQGRATPLDGRAIILHNADAYSDTDPLAHQPLAQNSRPGESIRLDTPELIGAFTAYRKGMDKIYGDYIAGLAKSHGWDGDPTYFAIKAHADELREAVGRDTADARHWDLIAKMVGLAEFARRTAYTPFMRQGDYFFRVVPKIGTEGWTGEGYPPTTWYSRIDSRLPEEKVLGGSREKSETVEAYRAELQKTFPDSHYDLQEGYYHSTEDALRDIDIQSIEDLFQIVGRDLRREWRDKIRSAPDREAAEKEATAATELHEKTVSALLDAYYERLKAGFKKQALNIPGYEKDLVQTTGVYVNWLSSHIADMEHRNALEAADKAVDQSYDKQTIRMWHYWDQARDQIRSPLDWGLSRLRSGAFYWALGANVASTIKVLLHGPMLGFPVLSTGFGGVGRAAVGREYLGAFGDVIKTIRANGQEGLTADLMKAARTPEERALVEANEANGRLHARGAEELGAIQRQGIEALSPQQRFNRRVLSIYSSNISTADRTIRGAMMLSAFRVANKPGAMDKINNTWRRDAEWQGIPEKTPQAFAEFITDRTAGVWGGQNKSEAARSLMGGLLFLFRSYELNFLSALHQQMWHMGPEGKVSAAMMLGSLGMMAGAVGLPFAQDIEKAYEWAHKMITGVDPNLNETLLQWAKTDPLGLGANAGKTFLYGAEPFGIDIGPGLSFGDIASREAQSPLNILGPAASIFIGGPMNAMKRSGQSTEAQIAELLPTPIKNLTKAFGVYPKEGVRTMGGDVVVPPAKLSNADLALQSAGLRPNTIGDPYRERERDFRLVQAQRDAATGLNHRLKTIEGSIIMAQQRGDTQEVARLQQSMTSAIANAPPGVKAGLQSIRNAARQAISPEAAAIRAAPKAVRGQVAQPIFGQQP